MKYYKVIQDMVCHEYALSTVPNRLYRFNVSELLEFTAYFVVIDRLPGG